MRPEMDRLATAAALALTALAALAPPDIVPWSGIACALAAAAGLACLALGSGGLRFRSASAASLLILLPFPLASLAAASCRARAIDEAAGAALLVVAFALGTAAARRGRDGRATVLTLLAGLGAIVALQAILQAHVLWPRQVEAMRGLDPASNPLLARLLEGRPSGPFSLPAALGGFLVMALAATAGLLRAGGGAARRGALAVAALLMSYALFMTRSFGALLALLAAVGLALPAADRRVRRALAAAALAVALGGAVWFARGRSVEFAGGDRTDPLTLRIGNWGAAGRMLAAHPILGVGPGAFGTTYPRVMRPGMNETRYAHNSYLQAAACWGAWILLPLGLLLTAFAGAARRAWRGETGSRAIGLAVVAGAGSFLAHNAVDFTAYQPGVALPGALLLGLAIGDAARGASGAAPIDPAAGAGGRVARLVAPAGAAALILLLLAHAVTSSRSRLALSRAQEAAEAGDVAGAARQARRAIAARPADPDPHQFLAELILAESLTDRRAEGERAAAAALRLDPEAAILHHDRALYHSLAGEGAAAYREEFIAHRLNPLKPLYREGLRGGAAHPDATRSVPEPAP